jgi:hypothetical protein
MRPKHDLDSVSAEEKTSLTDTLSMDGHSIITRSKINQIGLRPENADSVPL